MRKNLLLPFAALALAFTDFVAAPTRCAAEEITTIIDHNASIVVNGWKLKGETISRRSDGIVKIEGNAHADHPGYAVSGTAYKIVLNTSAGKVTFSGGPRVVMDGRTHVTEGNVALVFSYKTHAISEYRD